MQIPSIVVKILAAWAGLGALVYTGVIPIAGWLGNWFNPSVVQGTQEFIGAVIVFINVLKAANILKSGGSAEVKAMSESQLTSYALNVFK